MKREVYFALLCEGSSDAALVRPLERLCVIYGADEARGFAPDFGRLGQQVGHSIQSRIEALKALEPTINLLFIHRDADAPAEERRLSEIAEGMRAGGWELPHVPIIPIHETEAWLLLDEEAIRRIAQNPRGRAPLSLPPPHRIEQTAHPKELLQEALRRANGGTGRRAERFRGEMSSHRRRLLEELDVEGPIRQLAAWQRLCDRIEAAMRDLHP